MPPFPAEPLSPEAIRLQLRTWPEVEHYLEGCRAVILPLGSTEQHGPTGAIGTDALTAEAVSAGAQIPKVIPHSALLIGFSLSALAVVLRWRRWVLGPDQSAQTAQASQP